MATITESLIARRASKAVVVDGAKPIMTFFGGPDVADKASSYIGLLPEADTGRYGIDVSVFCGGCLSYHSPEADCPGPATDLDEIAKDL
jgi:hypothetical protein